MNGMTPSQTTPGVSGHSSAKTPRVKRYVVALCVAIVITIAIAAIILWRSPTGTTGSHSVPYLGVYERDAPGSYAGVEQFARGINRQPNIVTYYSPWLEPFQLNFATSAASHGAKPLIELDPKNISLASIAAGQYDDYLSSLAAAIKAFGKPVIVCFGHEMNGDWYSWGYQHTSASVFVAAWRHMVDVFRSADAKNVTWLWTVNIIDNNIPIPNPAPWWPGKSYVNWVGIDGYYYTSSLTFPQVFGPTIVDVRAFTRDPILITETGAVPAAGQSAKVADLFSGVQTYGLLGFVWFDAYDVVQSLDWRLQPSALAEFRREAKAYMRPAKLQNQVGG